MPGTCVIGLQWGDEAKGKLVDLLTPGVEIVVRYQGGANAGHTVVTGEDVYKLHHVPSGILHEGVTNIVSTGVVINPPTILQEIDGLEARGVQVQERLLISDRAHAVFPWHIAEDRVLNSRLVGGNRLVRRCAVLGRVTGTRLAAAWRFGWGTCCVTISPIVSGRCLLSNTRSWKG